MELVEMYMRKNYWFRKASFGLIFLSVLLMIACTSNENTKYNKSIATWHKLRIDSLKGETGFLNLAGLYWLHEGVNSFGSDTSNTLVFPPKAAPRLGQFILKSDSVYLLPLSKIIINGKTTADTTLIYTQGKASQMHMGSLHWFVIKRGNEYGIRLRDFEHPLLSSFDSIDYYPTSVTYRVKAKWNAYDTPKKINFSNVLGMEIRYPILGNFSFRLLGKSLSLEPLGEPEPGGYFVMFYDKTSGQSTYGSGRYLYVTLPDSTGYTYIDFNKAFNPPCAFTEYATCLFPHKANRLPVFVKAGEKFTGH